MASSVFEELSTRLSQAKDSMSESKADAITNLEYIIAFKIADPFDMNEENIKIKE